MTAVDELKILKANLPKGDIEEKFVNEYHSILTVAQSQSSESLSEHFIPTSELRRQLGAQVFDEYGELVEASYSSVRYCDRNFFTFKLDKAIAQLDSTSLDRKLTKHPEKKVYSLPKIPLTDPESLWLREVYESFKKGEEGDVKALKVKLQGRIPANFEPEKIDERLLLLGRIITLYGIWHVAPDTTLLGDADLVIRKVRELIFENTKRKSITAEEIADSTKLPQREVELLIKQIRLWGFFWSEVLSASEVGYSEVEVNDRGVFEEYYQYAGVEHLIIRLNERYEAVDKVSQERANPLEEGALKDEVSKEISTPTVTTKTSGTGEQQKGYDLYLQVKALYGDGKDIDEIKARHIIEYADDAIKAFGETNQEEKVELRKWKSEAESVLPPITVEELKKRAEGSILRKAYPKRKSFQIILLLLIGAVIILFILVQAYTILSGLFTQKNDSNVNKQLPTLSPTPEPQLAYTKLDYSFDLRTYDENQNVVATSNGHASGFTIHFVNEDVSLSMVKIPSGDYLMGSEKKEGEEDAHPQHRVDVQSFYMSRYEVTNAQWLVVTHLPQVNRRLPEVSLNYGEDELPVTHISWEDAVEFCDRLSRATGMTYRLPTEGEWEYACRAGTATPYHFGKAITTSLATYNHTPDRPVKVGSFMPNKFGLYDMHGNVWEWCQDLYHENYKGAPTDGSEWKLGKVKISQRVIRGGSYINDGEDCQSAHRYFNLQHGKNPDVGFRVAASLDAAPPLREDGFDCTDGWKITGYFTPKESDYTGSSQTIAIEGVGSGSFISNFLESVKTEGWGQTRQGWYLGYYDNKWHKSDAPLTNSGQRLGIGTVAVDPAIISLGSVIRTPTLPHPWNASILTAGDIGVKEKHIDIYTGEGREAEQETFRVTGKDEYNKHICVMRK